MLNSRLLDVKFPEVSLKLKFGKAYAEAEPKEPIVLVGSYGFVEIAINQGNAADKFNVKVGDKITVIAA